MSTVHALSPNPSAITGESMVGELVAARPLLARFFEKLGIDYCCGGQQTLAVACARHSLELNTTVALLDSAFAALADGPAEFNAAALGLGQLTEHIESTHHAYLKAALPRLVEMADHIADQHGSRDARLNEVAATVNELAGEMLSHLQKEEIVLFPLVREIESGVRPGLRGSDLAGAIAQMEAEHQDAGKLTVRLRELTDGFTPDAQACNTHRALLAGLSEFESDLHRHVHKENNVLFPRALAFAGSQR